MANFVFRKAKFGVLADQDHNAGAIDFHNDQFAIAFTTTALDEATYASAATMAAIFTDASGALTSGTSYSGGSAVEYSGTNYARGSCDQTNFVNVAVNEGTLDGTSSHAYLTATNTTISSMGAVTDTPIVGLIVYRKETASSGSPSVNGDENDALNIPISYHDFSVQPDGQDMVVQWDAIAGAGTIASTGGVILKLV